MKLKNLFVLLVAVFVMTACGKGGDKEIEKQIVGTWNYTGDVEEDGIAGTIEGLVTFNSDNTYKETATVCYVGVSRDLWIKLSCTGKWSATVDKLIEKVDESSLEIEFSSSYLSMSDMTRSEADRMFRQDMAGENMDTESQIISISDNKIKLVNDEGRMDYTRVR